MQYFKEEIKHAKSILDVQIIVPCKQGVSSVASLNHIAQQIYNPKSKKQYKIMKSGVVQWVLKVGDKVINKQNKYQIINSDGFQRKSHKLTEWHQFCDWILTLPYAKELITYTKENAA